MLTISQLASYAGLTVRAVRHYHAKGLLPEPARDRSGYRRYSAADVVELIRIRTLAEAGVPLSRVQQLLGADDEEFAVAVAEVDRRLRGDIRDLQRHRQRIALLAAGDSLALPPEAVAYLDRMRDLGFQDRMIEMERDSWILIAAAMPDQVPTFMAIKHATLENETLRELYLAVGDLADFTPEDPRLPLLADRVAAFIEAEDTAAGTTAAEAAGATAAAALAAGAAGSGATGADPDPPVSDDLVALLDTAFLEAFPCAPRLLELLEERGWTGLTNIRRIDEPTALDEPAP